MDHGHRTEAALALLLVLAATADAFGVVAPPHALQQRRGLHTNSNSCGGRGVQVHCMKRPRTQLAHRGGAGVLPPRLPEHDLDAGAQEFYPGWRAEALEHSFALESVSRKNSGVAADDFERFYGEPTEDLAKMVVVGVSLAVAFAAVFNVPISSQVSAHTISGAISGMAAVVLLGNPFFGGSFGASMNKSYQNLVPLLGAAFNKGVVCGTYAAAYGAISSLTPVASVTVGVVGVLTVGVAAMVTGLVTTATEVTMAGNLGKARELKLSYILARGSGMTRFAAVQLLWAKRPTLEFGCRKAFWSATKLNVLGFEVFYMSWYALASASPWIGGTVMGNAVGGAMAGALYAASMALTESLAARDGAASTLAYRLRVWVVSVRAQASQMTLSSFAAGVRFASYKMVFDSLARTV